MVMQKFDKNQYQILLYRFDALRQKGSVVEYQAAFEKIAQCLLLYNSGYDDTYFVNRFVVGLKEEIRSVIALHRPKDDVEDSEEVEVEDETILVVGQTVDSTQVKCRMLKVYGRIGKLEILILVDSGSVGTFVSQQLATWLEVPLSKCTPTQFVTADGGPMVCS
ncbi:unnamed protein product [Miscanthus lutarioriparius]|uniref:Retrotransposon gag domain-containing protein n=1 Tax=Miscanthus lutarioriparius TaxID=422564 RepID=A0A811MK23_9POAL|nr:unnamed protein product [Miscanthus lutarioriparius]